jgi:uncharacterized protein (DUF427 family)
MNHTSSKGKEIKIPGPDHPITISPAAGKVRVTVAGRTIAESTQALRLEEKGYPPVYYLPRNDADMSLLVRATHYSYCPYKGDCAYYSILIGGAKSEYAVWTYEKPYEAVAAIKGPPGVLSHARRCNRSDRLRTFTYQSSQHKPRS